jgi:hypothetical protein
VTAGRTFVANVATRARVGFNVPVLEEGGSGNNVDGLEAVRAVWPEKLEIVAKNAAADGAAVVEMPTILEEDAIDAVVGAVAVVGGKDLAVDILGVRAV